MTYPNIGILGTGSYVPERIVSNDVLARSLGIDDDWIFAKTGIRERRFASPDEATSDMAARAAERALASANVPASALDLVVVATSSPDCPQPATACTVQAMLCANRAAAFDLNAVCAGFVYALGVTWSAMRGDPSIRSALVIGADTYSRILDPRDRKTCVIFGDGAGAVVLGHVPEGQGILACHLGADGTRAHLVGVSAGGSRKPASVETVRSGEHFFRMEGRQVRGFAEEVFPSALRAVLPRVNLSLDDVDLVIPHQANGVILDGCARRLGLGPERVHSTIERYGNTGGASIPVTLDDAVQKGRVRPDDCVVLVGFGGGLSWGSVVVRWADTMGAVALSA